MKALALTFAVVGFALNAQDLRRVDPAIDREELTAQVGKEAEEKFNCIFSDTGSHWEKGIGRSFFDFQEINRGLHRGNIKSRWNKYDANGSLVESGLWESFEEIKWRLTRYDELYDTKFREINEIQSPDDVSFREQVASALEEMTGFAFGQPPVTNVTCKTLSGNQCYQYVCLNKPFRFFQKLRLSFVDDKLKSVSFEVTFDNKKYTGDSIAKEKQESFKELLLALGCPDTASHTYGRAGIIVRSRTCPDYYSILIEDRHVTGKKDPAQSRQPLPNPDSPLLNGQQGTPTRAMGSLRERRAILRPQRKATAELEKINRESASTVITPATDNNSVSGTLTNLPAQAVGSISSKTEAAWTKCKLCGAKIKYARAYKWDAHERKWVETTADVPSICRVCKREQEKPAAKTALDKERRDALNK